MDAKGTFKKAGEGDVRSPCPALNVLANHGHLSRDGKCITEEMLKSALMEQYNLADSLATFLSSTVMNPDHKLGIRKHGQENDGVPCINLSDLAQHNKLEHDVSLFHHDLFEGNNTAPQKEMVDNFVSAAPGNHEFVSWTDLAKYKARRYYEAKSKNPDISYDLQIGKISWSENAILWLVLGGKADHIPVSYINDFVIQEKLPEGWEKPRAPISFQDTLWLMAKMFGYSLVF
ncbi:hypothetical protein HDU99_006724 [Rhizoclosmatium hyalinum]|nr:hypothetical protein HDU99_006724 [Rhizoclosmatium hyalinum]